MNVSRRIHSLRAHRQKAPTNTGENWQNSCGSKQWCRDELATLHTLFYTVIIMVILMAIWGAWARKDSYS